MKPNFEPHDGIISGDIQLPALGRYVDFGGFWDDEFILTIDHTIYENENGERPEVHTIVNGEELNVFLSTIKTGSESDESIGTNPKNDVYRESDEVRLNRKT